MCSAHCYLTGSTALHRLAVSHWSCSSKTNLPVSENCFMYVVAAEWPTFRKKLRLSGWWTLKSAEKPQERLRDERSACSICPTKWCKRWCKGTAKAMEKWGLSLGQVVLPILDSSSEQWCCKTTRRATWPMEAVSDVSWLFFVPCFHFSMVLLSFPTFFLRVYNIYYIYIFMNNESVILKKLCLFTWDIMRRFAESWYFRSQWAGGRQVSQTPKISGLKEEDMGRVVPKTTWDKAPWLWRVFLKQWPLCWNFIF